MGHDVPNLLGVNQEGIEEVIQNQFPGYMAMGESGMHEMVEHQQHMQGPANTLPMMGGEGPFGSVAMGGMFTILKVREELVEGEDPGWYTNPKGTVAESIHQGEKPSAALYTCPMHPEVRQAQPGSCPLCGMSLKSESTPPQPAPAHHEHR